MHEPQPGPHSDDFRDRSLGLAIYGAVEILIGLVCAGLIPLTLVAGALAPVMDARVVLPSLVLYAAMAAIFVALGIGSIRARVWAQALTLSLSWVWLITGVATMMLSWFILPGLWRDLAANAGLEGDGAYIVAFGINLFLTFIYVVLPGAFVLFYRSPDVIATCRARDPRLGWAGRCPQRLLGLAVAYALGGVSIIAVPTYGYVFPFFGVLFSGAVGAICWTLVLLLSIALTQGTCRREPWAWWTAVAASAAAAVSWAATFARLERAAVFDAMALPPDQLMILERLWPEESWIHVVLWLLVWGSLTGYLVAVRQLFKTGDSDP